MRLWSLHPSYLDRMGLLGLWREALLAKKILAEETISNKTQGYSNHPQLIRFKKSITKLIAISVYLEEIYDEGISRGYKFNRNLMHIPGVLRNFKHYDIIPVTTGQLVFELALLRQKIYNRDGGWYDKHLADLSEVMPKPNPIFRLIHGPKEEWEKGKLKEEWVPYCVAPPAIETLFNTSKNYLEILQPVVV